MVSIIPGIGAVPRGGVWVIRLGVGVRAGRWGAAVKAGLSLAEVGRLPAVVNLVTAGQALGLGRTKTYELARTGEFPCRIIRAGKTYLVPTAELLVLLGLPTPTAPQKDTPAEPETKPAQGRK